MTYYLSITHTHWFDCLAVAPDYHVEISRRIKTEFENGKDYYKFHGERLAVLPGVAVQRPGLQYLEWQNERVFG